MSHPTTTSRTLANGGAPDEIPAHCSAAMAAIVALAALSLSACLTVGPDYRRPELPLPPGIDRRGARRPPSPTPGGRCSATRQLDRLVEEALAANQDLAAAAARVEEARALLGLADADRFPEVTGQAGASRTRLSRDDLADPRPGFPLEIERLPGDRRGLLRLRLLGPPAACHRGGARRAAGDRGGAAQHPPGAHRRGGHRLLRPASPSSASSRSPAAPPAREARRSDLQQQRFDAGTISEPRPRPGRGRAGGDRGRGAGARARSLRQTENRLTVLLGRDRRPRRAAACRSTDLRRARGAGRPALRAARPPARRPRSRAAPRGRQRPHRRGARRLLPHDRPDRPRRHREHRAHQPLRLRTPASGRRRSPWCSRSSTPAAPAVRWKPPRPATRESLALYTRAVQGAFAEVEDALVARRTGIAEREALGRQVNRAAPKPAASPTCATKAATPPTSKSSTPTAASSAPSSTWRAPGATSWRRRCCCSRRWAGGGRGRRRPPLKPLRPEPPTCSAEHDTAVRAQKVTLRALTRLYQLSRHFESR